MTEAKVKAAEAEARRFLERAAAWRKAEKERQTYGYGGSKESGALRRASLDLTRSLAEMRKP